MITLLDIGLSSALVATLLALAAAVLTRYCRRPQVAWAAWTLVLVKLVVPGFVIIPLDILPSSIVRAPIGETALESDSSWRERGLESPWADGSLAGANDFRVDNRPAELSSDAALVNPRAAHPMLAIDISRWAPLVCGVWLIGSAAWVVLAAVRIMRFRRVLQRSEPAPVELRDEARRLAGGLGLKRAVDVRVAAGRVPPLVWSIVGTPTILLPAGLLKILSRDERRTVLAHELAHLAGRGRLARWLELAALAIYWWHPVAWWARRNVERAEEQWCDARFLALLPALARPYAAALLAAVEYLAEPPARLPWGARGFSQVDDLKRRMEMILAKPESQRVGWPLRSALLAAALVVVPLSIRTLWAEPPAPAAAPAVDDDAQSEVNKISEMKAEVTKSLDELMFAARLKLQMSETNQKRRLASARQVEAARAAYEAETVTLDQLLEAQRRFVEAEICYARTVTALCPDPVRGAYMMHRASLVASNNALNEARRTWKSVHAKYVAGAAGGEATREAQAREQYFQFKTQVQEVLKQYLEAEQALKAQRGG